MQSPQGKIATGRMRNLLSISKLDERVLALPTLRNKENYENNVVIRKDYLEISIILLTFAPESTNDSRNMLGSYNG